MKDRLLVFMILLIGLMISGCDSKMLNDIQNANIETATQTDELIMFTVEIIGYGDVEVSSPSIESCTIHQNGTFYVRYGETVHLEASGGDFLGWASDVPGNKYDYTVFSPTTITANFSVPVEAHVVGAGKLLVDGVEVSNGNSLYSFAPVGTIKHISIDKNGCELSLLTLNGSDILNDVPGDFVVGSNGMEIEAKFWVFTRYLVIEEISYVPVNSYEIRLDGYEANDETNILPFIYTGGGYETWGYVQHLGMNGYIENQGNKTLYVHTDFDGDMQDYVISPKRFETLDFTSDNYLEGRLVKLNITISDKRF